MSSIKKILIIYPYLTENISKIFEKFARLNPQIYFLTLIPSNVPKSIYFQNELNFENLISLSNIKVERVYFCQRKNKNPILSPFTLFIKTTQFKPDVILFLDEAFSLNLFSASLIGRLLGIDVYFYSFENVVKKYSLLKKIAIKIIKKFLRYGFVCNEEAIKVFNHFCFYPKVKKVWWGVDVENFSKEISFEEREKLKTSLGIDRNQKVIGYVGRFIEEKGIRDLIKAFKNLDIDSVLIFIGDGPEKLYLEKVQKEINKKIIILSPQNRKNLVKYYNIMDVLVLPSRTTEFWKEQYGRVLIEAMASGVSVVGSSSGAIPEVIGDVGSIFTEGDIDNLKRLIEYEFNNKTKEKIKKLKERAKMGSADYFVRGIMDFIKNTQNES